MTRTTRKTVTAACACGHPMSAHTHYRKGTDCSLCDCPKVIAQRVSSDPAAPRHEVTHVPGRRVTCSCGWSTAGNVQSQDAGVMLALAHLRPAS